MPTKTEMEEEINERLGLDMEWSQMKKNDLEQLLNGLDDEDFIKKFVGQYANTVAGDKVQDQVEDWKPGQGIKLLAQMQEGKANPMDFFM